MTMNGHANAEPGPSSTSPLYTVPPGHLLLHLSSGKTSAFQLPFYPAVSFYLYIPTSHPVSRRKRGESFTLPARHHQIGNGHAINGNGHTMNGNGHAHSDQEEKQYPLVVCMHGSSRDAEGLRNRWADLAEKHGFVVLAPLFPADMETIDGMLNYKLMRYPLKQADHSPASPHIRYDHLLLEMVDLIDQRWGYIHTDRFGLTGYSGGAQFVHRFFYFHPDRVHTLCVGAPGISTPLDPTRGWPHGIADVHDQFSIQINPKDLQRTFTQLVIGLDDTWRPTADDGTAPKMNRIDGLRMLRDDWISRGIQVEYEEIPGVAHEEMDVIHRVQPFMIRGVRREFG